VPAQGVRRLAAWLDIPPEAVADTPHVELAGPFQVRVSNHRGLARFDAHTVAIRLASGGLCIEGDALVLGWVDAGALLVTGHIRRLTFSDEPGGGPQ
jgi:sporulation protein YqfC